MPAITTIAGFIIRMLIAAALGAAIGIERELRKHYAGIVTNIIVCVGAFGFTSFSYLASDGHTDVTRIAAQIVCGIGFLGAGVILSDGTKVKGINTAATIWAAAAVGILCCLERIWFALILAAMVILSHLLIHPISEALRKQRQYNKTINANEEAFFLISLTCREEVAMNIKEKMITYITGLDGVLLRKLDTSILDNGNVKIHAGISMKKKNNETVENIIAYIATDKNIISAGWKNSIQG